MEQAIVNEIVRASGVQAGELILVHFWGEQETLAEAEGFMRAVAALGAAPLLLHQARTANRALFASARDGAFGEKYFRAFAGCDAVLDVFAYPPVTLGEPLPPPAQARYRQYMAGLFRQLTQCKRFTQIRLPTAANAEGTGLAPEEFTRRMTEACRVDCTALHRACKDRIAVLSRSPRLVLRTGQDCTLHFDLTARTWLVDAGDGDWPCGEVYIAPVEEATRGSVYFPALHVEGAGRFEDVTLQIEAGRVTDSSCAGLNAFLATLPPEGRVVAELGLGMNPGVQSLCGCTVLDEKAAGTFHIALGANDMFGGRNAAPLHLDLVGQVPWTLEEEHQHE